MIGRATADGGFEDEDPPTRPFKLRFDGLPVRPYKIRIDDPTGRFSSRWFGGGNTFADAKAVTPEISEESYIGTIVVPTRFAAESTPVIHGDPVVGARLTATSPTFNRPGATITQGWLRDGRAITGTSRAAYRVKAADVGHRLTYRVAARKKGEKTVTVTSAPTGRVRSR